MSMIEPFSVNPHAPLLSLGECLRRRLSRVVSSYHEVALECAVGDGVENIALFQAILDDADMMRRLAAAVYAGREQEIANSERDLLAGEWRNARKEAHPGA